MVVQVFVGVLVVARSLALMFLRACVRRVRCSQLPHVIASNRLLMLRIARRFSAFFAVAFGTSAVAQGGPPPSLPTVVLQDQFDVQTDVSVPHSPAILLVAGRAGSAAMKRWMLVMREAAPAHEVRVIPIADLKGAPFFIKGRIKASMPKDTTVRILLDWDGRLARVVRGDRGDLVAAVYGGDGKLRKWEALSTKGEDAGVAQALVRSAQTP